MAEERLLTATEGLIRQGDELQAQHITELQRTIASLHEILRDLASSAMKLREIAPPPDPPDEAVIEDVVRRASKVLEYLEPPSH
jgi:hypothetical protein